MPTRCSSCGKDVEPRRGPGAAPLCPECRSVMAAPGGGAAEAGRAGIAPPLKGRGAEFRNRHSVEAGAAFSKSAKVLVANLAPFLVVTLVVLSPEVLYTLIHVGRPLEEITAKSAQTYNQFQTILGGLLRTMVTAAIISGVFMHLRGSAVTLGSIFSSGLSRVLPALWTGILAAVATLLPLVPGYGITVFGVVGAGANSGLLAVGGILIIVGFVFSMIVSTMVYVAVAASVVEKCNGFPAIKRSAALTKGNRGQIFVIILALAILTYVAGRVTGWAEDYRVTTFLNLLVAVVMSAFGGVFAGVVYYNLRAVKEGIGIEELAKAFD